MSDDQNFKNLILDYPHEALAFFASNSKFETIVQCRGQKRRGSAASARPGEAQRARWPPHDSVAGMRRSHRH